MGGDISRLRGQINDVNNEITKDTLSKNKMVDDIRRHADLNDSVNPKPDIPIWEIAQNSHASSVVDSYGIPIILDINYWLNPSGFNTDVNKYKSKNFHINKDNYINKQQIMMV